MKNPDYLDGETGASNEHFLSLYAANCLKQIINPLRLCLNMYLTTD